MAARQPPHMPSAGRLALASAAAAVRTASRISPSLGAAAALPLFMNTRPRMAVRSEELPVIEAAERSELPVPGVRGRGGHAVAYAWPAPRTAREDRAATGMVLLVHGWGGRAAQFAPLVRELRAVGLGVVAFDAPAHGSAPGRGTFIVDFHAAMAELQRRHGAFRAVVGHSFGAFAALIAVAEGLETSRLIAISSPSDSDFLVRSFAAAVGLGKASTDALRDRFARRLFPGETGLYERYSAAAHPLPDGVRLLLVHDDGDRTIPLSESERLRAAHSAWLDDRVELMTTTGLGHQRILSAPPVLEAVTAFVSG